MFNSHETRVPMIFVWSGRIPAGQRFPDLVEKYKRLLQRQWATHQELGTRLGEGGQVASGQKQLEALRALGYID